MDVPSKGNGPLISYLFQYDPLDFNLMRLTTSKIDFICQQFVIISVNIFMKSHENLFILAQITSALHKPKTLTQTDRGARAFSSRNSLQLIEFKSNQLLEAEFPSYIYFNGSMAVFGHRNLLPVKIFVFYTINIL